MSTEYVSVKDKGLLRVEGKSVRVVGSLAETFCQLLNEVYHDKDTKAKRSHVSFEEHSNLSVLESIYNSISNEDNPVVYISTPDKIEESYLKSIVDDIKVNNKGLHLITALHASNNTLDEEKEEMENVIQLENYVLERQGKVYRVVLGDIDAT